MGKAIHFEDMYYELRGMDLAVFAVSVDAPLLRLGEMKKILEGRKNPNLMLIDISQPRSIEENIGSLPSVELRNIDDLKSVLEENLKKRLIEAEKAKQIISEELKSLDALLGRLLAEPLISSLYIRVEDIRGKELQKALRMVRNINEEQKLVIENLTKKLAESILQLPIENMRKAALNRDSTTLSAARKLFKLDEVD
jgi:glutamyl-tRNA reductase